MPIGNLLKSDLIDLECLLAGAQEPSRRIDTDIAIFLRPDAFGRSDSSHNHENGHIFALEDGKPFTMTTAPYYTKSVDDVIDLLEKVADGRWLISGLTQAILDRKYMDVRRWSDNAWEASLVPSGPLPHDLLEASKWPRAIHANPALALCLVLVRALIQECKP